MPRQIILTIAVVYFVLLTGLVLVLDNASPGPVSQDILGVAIGSNNRADGIVYLSGRHLLCTSAPASGAFASICKIQIAGTSLELHTRQTEPIPLGGICEAFYKGQQWPCSVGSRHDHVYRFAYIETPLGLSRSQLDFLRLQYLFENLPEWVYFPVGVLTVSVTSAIVVLLSTITLLWSAQRPKSLTITLSILAGGSTFASVFLFAVQLTTGFWD